MTFSGGFSKVFRPVFDPGLTALPWYRAGGAPLPVAAYQPKGAASLAASYINLANPGTYDAAPGTAPTLTADGWSFNGTTQYLMTGIVPKSDQDQTMIVRYSGRDASVRYLCGQYDATNRSLSILYDASPTGTVYWRNGDVLAAASVATASAVLAISGVNWYKNGLVGSGTMGAWAGAATLPMYIGAINGVAGNLFNGSVQAFAYYNTTLTAPQVAAVSAAMAAL